eukprot:g235.t1
MQTQPEAFAYEPFWSQAFAISCYSFQAPGMSSPKDFVFGLIFGIIAFSLAVSVHWFNEERSAKIEVLLTKGLEDCRSVDANKLDTENRGRLVHVQGQATGQFPIRDAQFQDSWPHLAQFQQRSNG